MDTISFEELKIKRTRLFEHIKSGSLFIHPTDTVYGIGCNAEDETAVEAVRKLKQRPITPFSVIAPSKKWIIENCIIKKQHLDMLPGPYTFILKLKNLNAVANNVSGRLDNLAVRIPDHWISSFVAEIGIPIITTTANIAGRDFMTSVDNLDPKLKSKMRFIIYEGEKKARRSMIVNTLTGEEIRR